MDSETQFPAVTGLKSFAYFRTHHYFMRHLINMQQKATWDEEGTRGSITTTEGWGQGGG